MCLRGQFFLSEISFAMQIALSLVNLLGFRAGGCISVIRIVELSDAGVGIGHRDQCVGYVLERLALAHRHGAQRTVRFLFSNTA